MTLHRCHIGRRAWYIVPVTELDSIKNLYKKMFNPNDLLCPDLYKHKKIFFNPSFLAQNDIKFTERVQLAGETLAIMPGSFYFGVDLEPTYMISKRLCIFECLPYFFWGPTCTCKNVDEVLISRFYHHPIVKSMKWWRQSSVFFDCDSMCPVKIPCNFIQYHVKIDFDELKLTIKKFYTDKDKTCEVAEKDWLLSTLREIKKKRTAILNE